MASLSSIGCCKGLSPVRSHSAMRLVWVFTARTRVSWTEEGEGFKENELSELCGVRVGPNPTACRFSCQEKEQARPEPTCKLCIRISLCLPHLPYVSLRRSPAKSRIMQSATALLLVLRPEGTGASGTRTRGLIVSGGRGFSITCQAFEHWTPNRHGRFT